MKTTSLLKSFSSNQRRPERKTRLIALKPPQVSRINSVHSSRLSACWALIKKPVLSAAADLNWTPNIRSSLGSSCTISRYNLGQKELPTGQRKSDQNLQIWRRKMLQPNVTAKEDDRASGCCLISCGAALFFWMKLPSVDDVQMNLTLNNLRLQKWHIFLAEGVLRIYE